MVSVNVWLRREKASRNTPVLFHTFLGMIT